MADRKAKTFAKDANYAFDSNRLWDRMNRCQDAEYLLDMELSYLCRKRNCGVGNTKDDVDESDVFDENYLTYLLGLENSVKRKLTGEDEFDPDYVMFLEYLEEHGKPYKLDVPVEYGVPVEEDEADPQYLMFLENLKVHGNSYMVNVPLKHGGPSRIIYEAENVHFDDVMKRKFPKHGCEYNIHKESYNDKKTNRRLRGVSNTLKRKKTRVESTERKFLHYGVYSAKKARTCAKGMKRNNPCSSTSGCYVQDASILDSGEAKDSDFYKRMPDSPDENVQEKRTIGEVIKKRKLMSHTGNHIQEERNLNVSNGKKSGVEGSGSRKDLVPVNFEFDHFQGKETTEKNKPISVTFADLQDKERTEKIPLNVDYLKDDRMVGDVIKKRKLMSHTGNYIQEERILNVSNGKKSGLEGSGKSQNKKITKLHYSDHFHGKQTTKKNNPISFSFADVKDKERTEKKNPIPLNSDYFKKDRCVNVIDNSRSAPNKSTFQKSVINGVYNLFLKNLEVIGESVIYKSGDNERVLYEVSNERSLKIVADSSNPPIKSDRPIKNNVHTSIAAKSRDQSKCKIVAGLPLTVQVATEKQSTHPSTSAVPASKSTNPPTKSDRPIKKNVHTSIAAESRDHSTCKSVAGLPLTVQVATEKQPTHPSTSAIPASKSTKPLLDNQLYNSLEVPHRVADNMRKRLLKILRRPYNKQEHERLWKEVSFRSAVLTHRDSRSGGSHRPGQMGRSLLDWNPDLSSEIDKVKSEPPKVLNLLRMLYFYIKKLACGNICKPWMDDSLMTIIHGSA